MRWCPPLPWLLSLLLILASLPVTGWAVPVTAAAAPQERAAGCADCPAPQAQPAPHHPGQHHPAPPPGSQAAPACCADGLPCPMTPALAAALRVRPPLPPARWALAAHQPAPPTLAPSPPSPPPRPLA